MHTLFILHEFCNYIPKLPKKREVCSSAAESGHLDVLKWVHDNGYKWDEYHIVVQQKVVT